MLAEALAQLGLRRRDRARRPVGARASRATFSREVALLDIGLPVMDGYELARRAARAAAALATSPLIAVTGYGQDADRARSRRAGFEQHLVKPIDLQQLAVALEAALLESGATDERRSHYCQAAALGSVVHLTIRAAGCPRGPTAGQR